MTGLERIACIISAPALFGRMLHISAWLVYVLMSVVGFIDGGGGGGGSGGGGGRTVG